MKVFTVKVDSVNAGEEVRADFITEAKKGDIWNRMKVVTVVSGSPDSERKFILQDHERLVIEGHTKTVVVYDREQNMSKIVDADPLVREKQAAADKAQAEANVARQEKSNEVQEGLAAQAAREQPKTNLGNPIPSQPGSQPPPPPSNVPPPTTPPSQSNMSPASSPRPQPHPAQQTPQRPGADTGQGATGSKEVKK